jgi:DNA repair protein RadC
LKFWLEIIATQADYEPDKESVVVVMMNTRLRPYAWHRVSLGTVNECPACPREIFRPVIAAAAYGFALMHNHPSATLPHRDLTSPPPAVLAKRLTCCKSGLSTM